MPRKTHWKADCCPGPCGCFNEAAARCRGKQQRLKDMRNAIASLQ